MGQHKLREKFQGLGLKNPFSREEAPKVFVALPNYDGKMNQQQAPVIYMDSLRCGAALIVSHQSSLLGQSFNSLYAEALNHRDRGEITHFLMVHNDIVPKTGFLKVMLDEMKRVDCDVLSVVAPLKTTKGLTSTGYTVDDDMWHVKRWTLKEIFEKEETFTHPDIVINTGLMLIDIRKPWAEQIYFTIYDKIEKRDGLWGVCVSPEDWNFSYRARKLGAKIYATRKVQIGHFGDACYGNERVWGSLQTDDNA